jgi:hypothetical protein
MSEFQTIITHSGSLAERLKQHKERKLGMGCGPYQWTPAQPGTGRGFYQSSRGLWMDKAGSTFDLRLEEANAHLGSRGFGSLGSIDGYYTDDQCDQMLQPIVARLPHGRGYLAGWTMGAGMCASLDADVYTDIEDAARAAHHMADRDAEKEREHEASLCRECFESLCVCEPTEEIEEEN